MIYSINKLYYHPMRCRSNFW